MVAVWIIVGIIVLAVFGLFIVRLVLPSELDDVTPGIQCDASLIDKSDVLWVIPLYKNDSILNHQDWCDSLLAKNKTLGMHGVYHTFNEFFEKRNSEYVLRGIDAFEKCFGKKPEMFKAPQLALSSENRKMIESMRMKVKGKWNQLFRKVYHCSDTGVMPNWFIRIF